MRVPVYLPKKFIKSNEVVRKMYKPTGISNFYVVRVTKVKGRVPNTLIAFFILVQFVLGLDCGLVNWFNKKYRCFLKCLSLGLTFWVVLVNAALFNLIHVNSLIGSCWIILSFFQCVSFVLLLKLAKNKVYDFIIKINLVSDKTQKNGKEIIGAVAFIYTIVILVTKLSVLLTLCTIGDVYCAVYIVPFPIAATYTLCIDFVPIIMAIIVYHELRCVMNMRETLKKPVVNVDVTKQLYIAVANIIDEISPLYHNLLMVKLFTELPKLLSTMYFMIWLIKLQTGSAKFTGEVIYIIHAIIQITVPAILAEMVKAEIEQIKLELYNHMMAHEDDEKLIARVHSLLSYMEVRPLQHSAWRFVPTDLRLPVSLCGLCTTYFIVILQFTHLVD